MNLHIARLTRCIQCLLSLSVVLLTANLAASGSGDLRSPDGDPVMLFVGESTFGDFASYGGPENSRLNFRVQAGEVVYIGLSRFFQSNGLPASTGAYQFRIRSEANNQIVFGPFTVSSSNENISSFDQAVIGPAPLAAGGYAVDERSTFVPDAAGVYYIEFSQRRPTTPRYIGLWDITVANNGQEQSGRVYSKNWAFRVPEIELEQPYCAFGAELSTSFYSYTADGFVTEINFEDSGFQPLSFNLAFNTTGPGSSGDLAADRQSVPLINATDNAAEHLIFLEEPDASLFPDGICGEAEVTGQLRCTGDNEFCIPVRANQPGQIDILLDFNQNGVYDEEVDRLLVFSAEEGLLESCVPWDGLLADGTIPGPGALVDIIVSFSQGVQHWSLFDGELMRNGFCVTPIRPSCSVSGDTPLFFDDINISEEPGTSSPQRQLEGCECRTEACRTWTNFEANADADCNVIDSETTGYGDRNTLNTWWFAFSTQSSQFDVPVNISSIEGPVDHCPGEPVEVTLVTNTSNDIVSIDWVGPNGPIPGLTNQTEVVLSTAGVYSATVTDDVGCQNTSQYVLDEIECTLNLQVLGVECSDNGTETNPSDDVFFVDILVTGSNSEGFTYEGETYTYGESFRIGPFNTLAGNISVEVTDLTYSCCTETAEITAPAPCSEGCAITGVNILSTTCENNGTPTDPSDDLFTFTLTVSGFNVGSTWQDAALGLSGEYDQEITFGPFPIAEGELNLSINDVDQADCGIALSVQPPTTCSDDCILTPAISNILCDDNDTPFDPSDDRYFFDMVVNGDNNPSVAFSVNGMGVYVYGTNNTFGPFPIASGDFDFTITDIAGPGCTLDFTLPEIPQPCSDACGIQLEDVILTCVEDPTTGEEGLVVSVLVSNLNPNSTRFESSTGVRGEYGSYIVIGRIGEGGRGFNFSISEDGSDNCTVDGEITSPDFDIQCPEDVSETTAQIITQQFSSTVLDGESTLNGEEDVCYLIDEEMLPGLRFQDRLSISFDSQTGDDPGLFSFYLFSDGGSLEGNLFSQNLAETIDCCNQVNEPNAPTLGTAPDLPSAIHPDGMQLVQQFSTVLRPTEDYNLLTSSLKVNVQDNYTYIVLSPGGQALTIRKETGEAVPVITAEEDVSFNLSTASLSEVLDNLPSLLDLNGPRVDNACGTPTFSFQDSVLSTCASATVIRRFDLTVGGTEIAGICEQRFEMQRLTVREVLWPESQRQFACDEEYPTLSDGNPSPAYTGFPFVYLNGEAIGAAGGDLAGLTVSFVDDVTFFPEGGRSVSRTWTILDACNEEAQFTQTFKFDLAGEPFFTCPISNHYCPIVEDDVMVWGMDPFACTATIELPEPELNNLCDTTGWIFTTEVYSLTESGDSMLIATLNLGDDRTLTDLPAGDYFIHYTGQHATETVNGTYCRFRVTDTQNPIAACKSNINISVGGNGKVDLPYQVVDQGSYDNCGIEIAEVRRTFSDEEGFGPFAPVVTFDCEDVSSAHFVELRLIDSAGNENFCTAVVSVVDNTLPFCTGLDEVTINCNDLPDGFDLRDTMQLRLAFGMPSVVDNCEAFAFELTPEIIGDDCAPNQIRRAFQAIDQHGNLSAAIFYQDVFLTPGLNYSIGFPADATVSCIDDAPSVEVLGAGCDSLTVEATVLELPGDATACKILERRFTVTNWCEWDGSSAPLVIDRSANCGADAGEANLWVTRRATGTFLDIDADIENGLPAAGTCAGNPAGYLQSLSNQANGRYTYVQRIRIEDDVPPEIVQVAADTILLTGDACSGTLGIAIDFARSCSDELATVAVGVDLGNNGGIDETSETLGELAGAYPNFVYTAELPAGLHRVEFNLEDACGNTNSAERMVYVIDNYLPDFTVVDFRPYALEALPESGDVDGDGIIEEALALVSASELGFTDGADCSGDLRFSVNKLGEVADPDASSLFLDCDDRYLIDLEVYLWDDAKNPLAVQPDGSVGGPNWRMKTVTVRLDDPTQVCRDCLVENELTINGRVTTVNGQQLAGVMITADGEDAYLTTRFGSFQVGAKVGDSFTLAASFKEDDPRQGLSAIDLLMLQRYILRIGEFDDPFQQLATDLNRDGVTNVLDLVILQGLILGNDELFPSAGTWRFVDASWNGEGIPREVLSLKDVQQCADGHDFIGVRLGDLNFSGQVPSLNEQNSEGVVITSGIRATATLQE